ncbi:MAG TPA: glycosyltransferase family 39 protein [Polyangiaceae bacterium]|jgi:4-amino-4-deoxy-L-arabinose transferase-like glycosyltransferase
MAVKESQKPLEPIVFLLLVLTLALFLVRLYAARVIGFGDSEALYATYAKFPQPAYLDHPGLVGVLASSLGAGTIPSPAAAHVATAALASAFPWLVVVVARQLGAPMRPAAIAGLVVAATPEIGVGLYAMTPDLLLSFLWLAFIGLCSAALEAEPKGGRSAALFLATGVIAGAAATAKITGVLLFPAMGIVVWLDAKHRRAPWPWLGIAAGLVPVARIALFESRRGWPMLHHRLVDTQHAAGFSFRNVGALFGGQLLYLSPVIAVVAAIVAWRLVRARREAGLLFWTFALPIVPLAILCLWSRVAEPHWLAPPLLALPLFAATHAEPYRRKLVAPAVGVGLAFVVAVHAWVLSPSLLRYAPASYDAKVDITNELYGWPDATRAVGEMLQDADAAAGVRLDGWVVGATWMTCAQLQAGSPSAKVGCATDVPSDFDDWAPPATTWKRADVIVFVSTDGRPPPASLSAFHLARTERVSVVRGGRIVRTFHLTLLEKLAAG